MARSTSSSIANLKRIVPRIKGKRIGVLGDLMLDRYLWGTASRLSPEAAVPIVDFVEQSECLGGAGNVAANIASLGARLEMFGVVRRARIGRRRGRSRAAQLPARGEDRRQGRPARQGPRHNGEDARDCAAPADRAD